MNNVEAFLLGMVAMLGLILCFVGFCCVRMASRNDAPIPARIPALPPHVDCHEECALAAQAHAIRALPETGRS